MRDKINSYQPKIIKPIIAPKCYYDESPKGYLLRLAEVNAYNSYKWLITINGSTAYNKMLSQTEAYKLLKDLSWSGFNNAYYVARVCHYPIESISSNNIRYCPLCLKENNYFRIHWQMKTAFICLKHKVWLKDCCPSCEEPVKYNRSLLGRCYCGAILANQAVKGIPHSVYLLQQYLLDIKLAQTTPPQQMIKTYLKLTMTERTDYCLFMLRWLPTTIIERRKNGVSLYSEINQLREQIIIFADLFIQGASGFWRIVEQLNELDKHYRLENKLEKLVFNKFYQCFYKEFPDRKFLVFRKLIEKYIKKFWKKQLTYRNILFNSNLIKNHPWIPINQVIDEFKLSPSQIQKAIQDKLIIVLEEQKENRKFILLYKPSIQLKIEQIKDKINYTQAMQILGVTKKQLNQLIEENSFSQITPPKKSHNLQWQFSLQEILAYLKELFEVEADVEEETVTIAEAMRIIGSRIDNPLPKLLNEIKDQEITVTIVNDYRNIKALAISKRELNNWIQEASGNGNKYFTIPQLAKILNINQQLTYQLVNVGLIEYIEDKITKKRLIKEEAISSFKEKYIFLAKISKTIEISSKTLIDYLAFRKVFPIDHLWQIKLRYKIYNKAHLEGITLFRSIFANNENTY